MNKIFLVLCIFLIIGCTTNQPNSGQDSDVVSVNPSQPNSGQDSDVPSVSASELKQKMIEAHSKLEYYKVKATVKGSVEDTSEGNVDTTVSDIMTETQVDVKNKVFKTTAKSDITKNGKRTTGKVEAYIVDGTYYVHSLDTGAWIKASLNIDLLIQQNDQMAQYIKQLSALPFEISGEETVNGHKTYVIKIEPNASNLLPLQDAAPRFSSNTIITFWINKKTFVLEKVLVKIDFEMQRTLKHTKSTNEITAEFSEINKPFTVKLPAKALNAQSGD